MYKNLCILFSFLFIYGCFDYKKEHILKDGKLDLTNYNFEKESYIALKGQWKWKSNDFDNQYLTNPLYQTEDNFLIPNNWNQCFNASDGYAVFTAKDESKLVPEKKKKELRNTNKKLKNLSYIDPLTGLFNRRFFGETLLSKWKTVHLKILYLQ
ncbi:MAG: GGDEF domain-containing protein [Spirochaetia bacterium]|nr:GGDEF domain-containing protein [Spirochaetia bacterium]